MESTSTVSTRDAPPPFKRPRISDCTTSKQQKSRDANTKGAIRNSRGKRSTGKLSKFTHLPLDIIFEIVSWVEPLDLLYLSRVSKSFRKLLNPSINRHLWSAARNNISNLPDCPLDLNEAQYASLIFENRCQACEGLCKPDSVEYAIRCRLCQPCHKELIRKGNASWKLLPSITPSQWEEICTLLPCSIQVFNGTITDDTNSSASSHENMPWSDYFVSELLLVAKQYIALRYKPKQLEAFITERRSMAQEMTRTGIAIQEWASRFALERRIDKSAQAGARVDEVKKKLLELGWTENDFPKQFSSEPYSEWNNHLSQPKALTQRSWKILQPKLIKILESVQGSRRQLRILQRLCTRFQELHSIWPLFMEQHSRSGEYTLPQAVLEHLPTIARLANEGEAELTITLDRLCTKSDAILSEFDEILESLQNGFTELVMESADSTKDSCTPLLERATSLFICTDCVGEQPLMTLQQAFSHRHDRTRGWNVDAFEYRTEIATIVDKVLFELGLPPDSSLRILSDLDDCLSCQCGHPGVSGKRLKFLDLITHLHRENEWFGDITAAWSSSSKDELLNDHDISRFHLLIRLCDTCDTDESGEASTKKRYLCRPCHNEASVRTCLGTDKMASYHLRAKHGLDFETKNIMYDPAYGSFLSAFLFGLGFMDDLLFDDSDSDDDL